MGGAGLNLTAADYVIHLDPWWNPAVEDQASKRAHRMGQERPVTVYRLLLKNKWLPSTVRKGNWLKIYWKGVTRWVGWIRRRYCAYCVDRMSA
ncbi:MAG: C-terminal helicase domain-containing protein [Kluyvera sp.]|uniref:C-terminal helicase domain-containing protein n=1 Tax=Kluyvera sp. TaxID=1538228 RepID=UPI003F40113B